MSEDKKKDRDDIYGMYWWTVRKFLKNNFGISSRNLLVLCIVAIGYFMLSRRMDLDYTAKPIRETISTTEGKTKYIVEFRATTTTKDNIKFRAEFKQTPEMQMIKDSLILYIRQEKLLSLTGNYSPIDSAVILTDFFAIKKN